MNTQKVKTCFTITFTDEQYNRAKGYVEDMKRHRNRIFWQGKEGKTDDELIIEQIAHRILSGFYNNEPFVAGKHIMRMDSSKIVQSLIHDVPLKSRYPGSFFCPRTLKILFQARTLLPEHGQALPNKLIFMYNYYQF